MMDRLDLVIRGGTVFDGSGAEGRLADVGIRDGMIVAVGQVPVAALEEIDATGKIVTPGFVDIHTHYDGQVTWEHRLSPSSQHGVTTVVMGNCGVGFAPCRADDRDRLVALMEGVEDIPEVVMTEGLPWNWETFPEYLDVVGGRKYDMDVVTQIPHSCLRVYVMGQRAIDGEDATAEDLAQMKRIATEAIKMGAIGFATSRSLFHRDKNGVAIPTKDAAERELMAIIDGMNEAGGGLVEALIDFEDVEAEFPLLRRMAERSGKLLTFTVTQIAHAPDAWKRCLVLIEEANRDGVSIKGQVMGRPMGMFVGLTVTFNPFSLHPSYQEIAQLPLAERVAILRQPEMRERLLAEPPGKGHYRRLDFLYHFDCMYRVDDPVRFDQTLDDSIGAIARREGRSPFEVAYDMMLEEDGTRMIHLRTANFVDGNMDAARALVTHPDTLLGLGDGGAHYGMICDAGYPSFMLAYWTRDCDDAGRIELSSVIKALSQDNAEAMGLRDRGRIATGYRADLNVIDHAKLKVRRPHIVFDLPAGGRRLLQDAEGFELTIVGGEITYRDGRPTGALPGQLVRGFRAVPARQEAPVSP
ncbi:amidohydrolase family protein [Rhizorhabdus sp.]|uniref:N-acyl-D-amino-acid deacylase family protein n=1 Tax=Rhizorhabdus sp. TaxID=1968843 RepID=UPI001989F997|nr:amidohydrolase family protein [Rhizorhabdus sp.]MBD3760204.1 amidohydrolase family protein [Rhizorhabdus sp.]